MWRWRERPSWAGPPAGSSARARAGGRGPRLRVVGRNGFLPFGNYSYGFSIFQNHFDAYLNAFLN